MDRARRYLAKKKEPEPSIQTFSPYANKRDQNSPEQRILSPNHDFDRRFGSPVVSPDSKAQALAQRPQQPPQYHSVPSNDVSNASN